VIRFEECLQIRVGKRTGVKSGGGLFGRNGLRVVRGAAGEGNDSQDKQPALHTIFRLVSVIHHPTFMLPGTTEPDSKIFAIGIGLNVPAFVWFGENVTADNSNGCAATTSCG